MKLLRMGVASNRHVLSGALLLACSASTVGHATPMADNDDESVKLAPIEVYRDSAMLDEVPGAATAVRPKEVGAADALSGLEGVGRLPGVIVTPEDALGRRVNIGIRGLEPRRGRKMLLLEDGAPIQLGPYGDPTTHYIPHPRLVDRIEVIKGAGTTRYGPQSVGGTINFLTKDPPSEPQLSVLGALGNNEYIDSNVSAGGTWQGTGLRLDLVHQEADGNQDDQKQFLTDFALKTSLELDEYQRITLRGVVTNEYQRGGEAGLREADFREDPRANFLTQDRFDVEREAVQLIHEYRLTPRVGVATNLYANWISREATRQAGSSAGLDNCPGDINEMDFRNAPRCGNQFRPRSYRTYGVEPRLFVLHNLFGLSHEVRAGIRVQRERGMRETFYGDEPGSTLKSCVKLDGDEDCRRRDWTANSESGYIENTTYLGHFTVTPGVRVEHWRLWEERQRDGRETEVQRRRFTEVLPGIGATYHGLRDTAVFAGVHRGLSPPPLTQVGERPDPEYSINYELGVRTRVLPGTYVDVTGFHIDYRDIIATENLPDGSQRFNAGKARMQGMEVAGRVNSDELLGTEWNYYLTGNVTRLSTKFRRDVPDEGIEKGNSFPYAPEVSYYIAAGMETRTIELEIGAQTISSQFVDNANTTAANPDGTTGKVPRYTIVNARAQWRPLPNVRLFMAAKNLADKTFIANRTDGITPGIRRLVFGGVAADF